MDNDHVRKLCGLLRKHDGYFVFIKGECGMKCVDETYALCRKYLNQRPEMNLLDVSSVPFSFSWKNKQCDISFSFVLQDPGNHRHLFSLAMSEHVSYPLVLVCQEEGWVIETKEELHTLISCLLPVLFD